MPTIAEKAAPLPSSVNPRDTSFKPRPGTMPWFTSQEYEQHIAALIKAHDLEKCHLLDPPEAFALVQAMADELGLDRPTDAFLGDVLKLFDQNGDNIINKAELAEFMRQGFQMWITDSYFTTPGAGADSSLKRMMSYKAAKAAREAGPAAAEAAPEGPPPLPFFS
eukprot:TRINITY_DN1570_c0_g1_i1.p1 TRINITY_DN1570_c0_g1~~TRINITY_DN1570_c0_g1_i1.p1  ORF type:complete len:176 (+),score=47.15 TRINITY_DN1570_c0_g1_i1:34-528(+)